MRKRLLGGFVFAVLIGAGFWVSLVVNYESDLGTDNVLSVGYSTPSSDGVNDALATLEFEDGAESLLWASLELAITVDATTYACGFASQSVPSEEGALVRPRLGADGLTFTTEVDATDEERFTHLNIATLGLGNESAHTMRFSKTDIFLAEDVRWLFVENAGLADVTSVDASQASNNTADRLEWYDYDLAVHRVNPKDGVYVIEVEEVWYKLKFMSYYNNEDESRYPTFQIAALDATLFPALQDSSLVAPSPCLIIAGDEDSVEWAADETITLVENEFDLRSGSEHMELIVRYEGQEVKIVETN